VTTQTFAITANIDDVTEQITASPSVTKVLDTGASTLTVFLATIAATDYDYRIGLRWDLSAIPPGAVIVSASLEAYKNTGGGAPSLQGECRCSGFNQTDAAQFDAGNSATFPSNRSKLGSHITGPTSTVLGDSFHVFGDIKAMLQLWCNLASRGDHFGVEIRRITGSDFTTYTIDANEYPGSNQARLVVEWFVDPGFAQEVVI
jgi:hypothetical protein